MEDHPTPTFAREREALEVADLVQGLCVEEVVTRLHIGLRLKDAGQRILAFYLVEMEDRRLFKRSGHANAVHFAGDRLGLAPRRARELLVMGRKLLELPAIDAAFCEQRIGWSKLRLLARVAVPTHEEAWLERAIGSTVRELERDVASTKPGRAPRKPGDQKALRTVRFPFRTEMDALTWRMVNEAKQKLSAERGYPVADDEFLHAAAEMHLTTKEDGSIPGRTVVDVAPYTVVLTPGENDIDDDFVVGSKDLTVLTDLGRIPVARVIDGNQDPYAKTYDRLRRLVLLRDDHRCRCCGGKADVMAHHITFRSDGGPTCVVNLLALCGICHGNVHEGLLVIQGDNRTGPVFQDQDENRHGEAEPAIPAGARLTLPTPRLSEASDEPAEPSPPTAMLDSLTLESVTLDSVPETIDAAWWRRHEPLIQAAGNARLELKEGVPLPDGEIEETPAAAPAPVPAAEAFADLVGQEDVRSRLANVAACQQDHGEAFPHTLLTGPAGTGKTTMALAIASLIGATFHRIAGPLLQDARTLLAYLARLAPGDVLFLDEIHAAPRAVLETLYEAMAEGQISLTLQAGLRSRTVRFVLPPFTVLGATTAPMALPAALRSRFVVQEFLGFYETAALTALVRALAKPLGLVLTEDAAARVAAFSRGTPREARALLARVRSELHAKGRTDADRAAVEAALRRLGYDEWGLRPEERRYLDLLRESTVPISLQRAATLLGTDEKTVADGIEPQLFRLGLILVTPRGRVASARGVAAA